ncbi:MAG: transporter substrate-binding domain-containing protein, partial [Candidatus Auribacterota bacterium]|nr:transporter substrate-binding domain-containing protein [Candidatus Auribacterota bacterium]
MRFGKLSSFWPWGILGSVIILSGCGDGEESGAGRAEKIQVVAAKDVAEETGDLATLKKNGELRILIQRSPDSCLPRRGSPVERERQLAVDFARLLGLKPVLVYLDDFEDLIPALLKGEGDLIVANLTVTESRKKRIDFTLPIDYSREQLVARANKKKMEKLSDLSGRIIGAQEGTSFL